MLIAVVSAEGETRNKIRGILGRYMWRVDADSFVFKNGSIVHDIIKELQEAVSCDRYAVNFYRKNKKEIKGFKVLKVGSLKSKVMDSDSYFSTKSIF